ncbi:aldo/keto reductase [Secundilactobacillus folii]|uniref:Aldo/keto reductase n=1 Tax=Secundilactobacillus folii TaxID=2678357 RepID=A0A7X2XTD7_9LACO|nr:aldo/keto reductase [Secundilactobacillus folii]MTV81322.1 aldo/keto reductase [Secundilactobacillus folii]
MFNSKVALGTWSWGSGRNGGDQIFGNHLKQADLQAVVDTAMAAGLNLWDTAAAYGQGSSETLLGNCLQKYNRSDYFLSTKFTPVFASDGEDAVDQMLSESLKRLHTDYVDLYWIHNSDDVEKWTPKMIPLVKQGLVKHIGVSNHNLAQIKRAKEILNEGGVELSAVQNHYSLLYPQSQETGILDYCHQNNITFFPYMVLEQGALSGKYNVDHPFAGDSQRARTYNPMLKELTALTDKMSEIADKYSVAVADIATAWVIQKGTTPIIGVTKKEYIADTKRATDLKLTQDEMTSLEDLAAKTHVNTRGHWEANMNK